MKHIHSSVYFNLTILWKFEEYKEQMSGSLPKFAEMEEECEGSLIFVMCYTSTQTVQQLLWALVYMCYTSRWRQSHIGSIEEAQCILGSRQK